MRRLRNVGVPDLILPDGRRIQSGHTFSTADLSEQLIQAWLTGGNVRAVADKKKTKELT